MKFFIIAILVSLPLIAQTAPTTAVDPWQSSAGAGVAITSGNSDTTNVNVSASTPGWPRLSRRGWS